MTEVPEITREESLAFYREQLAGIEQDLMDAMSIQAMSFSEWQRDRERVEELWQQFRVAKRKLAEVENEFR